MNIGTTGEGLIPIFIISFKILVKASYIYDDLNGFYSVLGLGNKDLSERNGFFQ